MIKGLPESKRAFSFDEVGTSNVKLQGSAAGQTYEQETASLFDQLKNAEAEADTDSTWL